MLKYKSIIFLLVCSFTVSTSAWAAPGLDFGNDTSVADVGTDLGADMGMADTGPEKSTPMDPDYQPEVTSSPDCTCRSVQTESKTSWLALLFVGAILGFSRKKWRSKK